MITISQIELANHIWPDIGAPVVQLFLELILDHLTLFFNHQNLAQTLRKLPRDGGFEGPDDIDFVKTDTDLPADAFGQAQILQCLASVAVSLAAGDDANAVIRTLNHSVIQAVCPHIGQCSIHPLLHEPSLLIKRRVRPAYVHTTRWQIKVLGQHNLDSMWVSIDRCTGLHHFLDGFKAHPDASIAAHRQRMQSQIQNALNTLRIKHRHAAGLENVVTLVRRRRTLGHMVITGNRDDAAERRGPCHVGMFQNIDTAIDSRALGIPETKHTVIPRRRFE